MNKIDFLRNLDEAVERMNSPYFVSPGNVNAELFSEIGIRFSNSLFFMFHNNQIGYDEMLVCFDNNDNVVAAKVSNPTQVFLIALNLTKLFYKVPIRLWRKSEIDSDELIIILQ